MPQAPRAWVLIALCKGADVDVLAHELMDVHHANDCPQSNRLTLQMHM